MSGFFFSGLSTGLLDSVEFIVLYMVYDGFGVRLLWGTPWGVLLGFRFRELSW